MDVLMLLFFAAAAVCFVVAAFGVASRVNLVAAGLLFWVLTELIPALQRI